jgi:tRNA(Ile)-lysidine synthase
MVRPDGKVLLTVSGGIDSMVMAYLFLQTGADLGIAHCNFTLRGTESDLDEKMVSEFAFNNKIPFHSIRFKTLEYSKEKGISVQMAARDLRYDWFEKIRNEIGYDHIAVAHNLNDNIETLLINLVRGTGIAGLSGIKPCSGHIIRPLLFATRDEISKFAYDHGIKFREDRSNADTKYLRNKIRHKIIPVLREINPSVEKTLSETAGRFSSAERIIAEFVEYVRTKAFSDRDGYISVNLSLLQSYLPNTVLLFELFRPFGSTDISMEDLGHIINGRTGASLSTSTHVIVKNRQELLIYKGSREKFEPEFVYSPAGLIETGKVRSARVESVTGKFNIPGPPVQCFDYNKISFPLIIREWKEGDFFFPLGMDKRKKLSDYFIDKKYSAFDKANALVLESEEKIICILGERIDNRFRVTETTRNVLIIDVIDV